ncbi:MAG: hypothetical protein PHO56_03775 [Patescibacteria group bacterium]|nr:hypothetical protein [Patescibacteria group bacterium]
MNNIKSKAIVTVVDFIYLIFSLGVFFIAYEYFHDIFTDFSRFQMTHSFSKNYIDLIAIIAWIVFSWIVVKYNKKVFLETKKSNI